MDGDTVQSGTVVSWRGSFGWVRGDADLDHLVLVPWQVIACGGGYKELHRGQRVQFSTVDGVRGRRATWCWPLAEVQTEVQK